MKLRFARHTALLLMACAAVVVCAAPVAAAQPVVPPIAPPKPAVPRAANAIVISTGDLNASVNWARQGNFVETAKSFNLFMEDWTVIADEVQGQSETIAGKVDDAASQVADVLIVSPPAAQTTYYPVLQNLQQVVEDANAELGQIAPASAALRINPTNLSQAVTWASQGNLAKAHDEFNQFLDDWSLVSAAVRQQSPSAADSVEAASAAVQAVIADPARPAPDPSEYYPKLQALQQVVRDTNAQLATSGPVFVAVPAGSIKISPGNLGESVDWANQGNLASARSEFRQFQGDWAKVKDAIRQKSPAIADQVEAAIARAEPVVSGADPAKEDYLAALQDLQTVVDDANSKLAN
jgi:hypothetical protein